jgi:hypothetical protein
MSQVTPKEIGTALFWIQTEPCVEVGEVTTKTKRFIYYKNYFHTLRVDQSRPWARQFFKLLTPNPRAHDDRMFALKDEGKELLKSLPEGASINWDDHP